MSGISDGISRRRRDRGIGHVRTTSWSRNKSNNKSNKCTLHLEGGPPTSQTSQQLPYIRPCSIFRFPPSPHLEVKPAARPPTYLSRQVAAKAQRGQTGSPPTHLLVPASGGAGAERSNRQPAHPLACRGKWRRGRREVKPAARPPTCLSRQVAAKAQRGQTGCPPTHAFVAPTRTQLVAAGARSRVMNDTAQPW